MSSRPPRPDAVLFDAAGTLIALREPVGVVYARMAAEAGAMFPATRVEEAFGRVFRAAPPNAHPGLSSEARPAAERRWWYARVRETFRAADQMVRIPDFDGLFDALFDYFASTAAWELRPGAKATLEALDAAGARLAVLSNFDHRLPGLLEALGIRDVFELVLIPTETGTAKPDAAFFHEALTRLKLAAHQGVYVGDDPHEDHEAAAGAGLRSVDVRQLAGLEELPTLLGFDASGAA